jgi:hypothetical protein
LPSNRAYKQLIARPHWEVRVLFQPEMEKGRSPLVRIPSFGRGFQGIRVYRSDGGLGQHQKVILAALFFVSMSPTSYSDYALALLFSAILIGGWLIDDPDYHTVLGSTTIVVLSPVFLFAGYRWWTNAMPFAAAHSERFLRALVVLTTTKSTRPEGPDNVI